MTMGDRVAVLRDGALQQVDTPGRVYERPANLFVAGFIGSPPMNLAQARVERGAVRLGELEIPVRGLDEWAGKDVILGVRPEDVKASANGSGVKVRAKIDRVEELGATVLGYFTIDAPPPKAAAIAAVVAGEDLAEAPITGPAGTHFCATFEPRSGVAAGDTLEVSLDVERLHFFDPETEAAIGAS
jgi:multiple sugar transport system ATP-binding protein